MRGGWLVTADIAGAGWRSIFLVNVPLAAVALLCAMRSVPQTRSTRPVRIDTAGTVLFGAALLALLVPLAIGHTDGWPLWAWCSMAAAPCIAGVFWLVERRLERTGTDPLISPELLRNRAMRSGLLVAVPFFAGASGVMFVVAVALQQGLHLAPIATGSTLAPMAAAFFVASLIAPRLVTRLGRKVVTYGIALQGAGLVVVAVTVLAAWPHLGPSELLPGMLVLGVGQRLAMTTLLRIVLSDVPADHAGMGVGVMATAQQSSMTLGVAGFGTLLLSPSPAVGMRDALAIALLTAAAGSAVAVALSLRLPDRVR